MQAMQRHILYFIFYYNPTLSRSRGTMIQTKEDWWLVRYKNSTNRWYENNASWRGDGLRRPNISRCTSTWQWLVLRSNLTKSKKNLNNYTLLNMSDIFCNKKFDNVVFVCKILNKKKKLHSSLHALKETEMLCFILRLYVNYFDLKIFFVFSQYSELFSHWKCRWVLRCIHYSINLAIIILNSPIAGRLCFIASKRGISQCLGETFGSWLFWSKILAISVLSFSIATCSGVVWALRKFNLQPRRNKYL